MKRLILPINIPFRGNIHYIVILLILYVAGLFSYFIIKHDFDPDYWNIDKDFKELVFIFIITSFVTIVGVEAILQIHKNKAVLRTLKILNYGYDAHELMARTINFMADCKVIEHEEIGIIFHNYYKTRKDQIEDKRVAKKRFTSTMQKHINYIKKSKPDLNAILNADLDMKALKDHRDKLNELHEKMISKFALSLKIDSPVLWDLTVVIQVIENNIWYIDRYFLDPTAINKKKRIFVGSYRLLYSLLRLLENKKLFYISEIEYDEALLGRFHSKIDCLLPIHDK